MIKRTVLIESDSRLSARYRQLVVERPGQPDATVPLEDLGVLLVDRSQTTITSNALSLLAEAGCAVLFCDDRHMPCSISLPLAGHCEHQGVMADQIVQSQPSQKRLWQQIVQAKLRSQAMLLRHFAKRAERVERLIPKVVSGDAKNVEGLAASFYFTEAFGRSFARDSDGLGANAWLNYGYALLRAAMARAICGAGLHPSLGVFHSNRLDPFALADDLMEPLRPIADERVLVALDEDVVGDELDPAAKRRLLQILGCEIDWGGTRYPLSTGLGMYAARFRDCVAGKKRLLPCPMPVFVSPRRGVEPVGLPGRRRRIDGARSSSSGA